MHAKFRGLWRIYTQQKRIKRLISASSIGDAAHVAASCHRAEVLQFESECLKGCRAHVSF